MFMYIYVCVKVYLHSNPIIYARLVPFNSTILYLMRFNVV